jgi:hypothetical protein
MLKVEIEKKKIHETKIITHKANKKNYEAQFQNNLILKDRIENKTKTKKD